MSSVHYQLGVACRDLNQLARAVEHFQKVAKPLQVSLSAGGGAGVGWGGGAGRGSSHCFIPNRGV
jgi:hypothetical protein